MIPSPEQIANLRRLADFLDDNHEKLVEFDQFDMSCFRFGVDETQYPHLTDTGEIVDLQSFGCGTSACAAGWAVTLEGMRPISGDFPYERYPLEGGSIVGIDWDQYIERVFGIDGPSDYWGTCFAREGTPRQVARRLCRVADKMEAEQERAA